MNNVCEGILEKQPTKFGDIGFLRRQHMTAIL